MNKATILILIFILFNFSCQEDKAGDNLYEFNKFTNSFCKGIKNLNIVPLRRGVSENLASIKSIDSVQLQLDFFQKSYFVLQSIDKNNLPEGFQLDYQLIEYEIELNKERLHLEKEFLDHNIQNESNENFFSTAIGKKWYAYFLKKWLNDNVSPDEMYLLGVKEVSRVSNKIKKIRKKADLDSTAFYHFLNKDEFFHSSPKQVQVEFEKVHRRVLKSYQNTFPFVDKIPPLKIERSDNEALKNVPAFYMFRDSTFFYNIFEKPFNKRQICWLYLHEGIPGHHYQLFVQDHLDRSKIKKLFKYYGYSEGWAAYVENLGEEVNAYQNDYDILGKWEWDLVRSVRVVLDVGINYYGWTDQQALNYWKKHIPNQGHIAQREINRIKKWPVQVITYKYGSSKFLEWKKMKEDIEGDEFNLKNYHKMVLENGALPFPILYNHLFTEKILASRKNI